MCSFIENSGSQETIYADLFSSELIISVPLVGCIGRLSYIVDRSL
jgi:hypothetical protein